MRTIGQMVRWYHPGRDTDLIPRVAIALTVGKMFEVYCTIVLFMYTLESGFDAFSTVH